jgi:hypothetical protein
MACFDVRKPSNLTQDWFIQSHAALIRPITQQTGASQDGSSVANSALGRNHKTQLLVRVVALKYE